MSRSHGAANSGWQQRPPAAEPDPRTGRPAQPQRPAQPAMYPAQPAPAYAEPQQAPNPAYNGQQGYYYPQAAQPAPAPQQGGRNGLSSFEPAAHPQSVHDFDQYPATQPPYAPPQQAYARQGQPQQRAPARAPIPAQGPAPAYRQQVPQYAPQAAGYEQWPNQAPAQDPHAYNLGGYLPNGAHPGELAPHMDPLQHGEWALPAGEYADPSHQQAFAQHGYEQPHGGALEPTYAQEEGGEYEAEEPRRVSWTMRIAGAIVVAIGLGYGLAQAYKLVLGSAPDGATPVVQSDSTPSKEKPLDPGGKQFSHTDSKVLGRLGDGGSSSESTGNLSQTDTDSSGAHKVTTLVVGRDGSIAPPAAPSEPAAAPAAPDTSVSVPGLTVVDAFGSAGRDPGPSHAAAAPVVPVKSAESHPVAVNPPATNANPRVKVKATKVIPAAASTASLPEEAEAAAAPQKTAKVATAEPAADEGATSASGANGYVVVLASVPASGSSRLDALKKFADMQQQYGSVLANKTPDVRETNLASKGMYHRLLVGPPGSRAQASSLCGELKTAGYKDCWVTAY